LFLKGTGFSPYIDHPGYEGLLAPEAISCAGLSSPRRLKPIHLDDEMYGLKAVPFAGEFSRKLFSPYTNPAVEVRIVG
jgi:hypothetical protein